MRARLFADLTPLRTAPAFRRLWIGSLLSGIGSQMTIFAVALQVYRVTGSSAAVGGVGLVSGLVGVVVGLLAGGVIDAFDRRTIVLIATFGQMAVSATLAAQAFAGLSRLWLLYVLVGVAAAISAVSMPARRTFAPRLLPRELLASGSALTMLAMHTGVVAGPSLAGVVTAAGGLKLCYLIDALSFVASIWATLGLPSMRPEAGAATRPGLRAVGDGLLFVTRTRVLAGVLLADLSATVLAMPIALFPAIDAQRFRGDPRVLGLLTAAVAVGGVIGSGLSGPLRHVRHEGRGVLVAGAVWGAALAAFGVVHSLLATLATLLVAGIADVISVVLRSTIVQTATPDAYRGRVSATDFVVGACCPQLGNFRAGLVANATSPGVSALTGGVAAVVGAGSIALAFPALLRYRAVPDRIPEIAAGAAQ